jgi:hypothetical protein
MGWVVNAMLRPLYPQVGPGTHCIGGWMDPRAGLDGCGISRPPLGFDLRTVQVVANRYTDWAVQYIGVSSCSVISKRHPTNIWYYIDIWIHERGFWSLNVWNVVWNHFCPIISNAGSFRNPKNPNFPTKFLNKFSTHRIICTFCPVVTRWSFQNTKNFPLDI